LFSHVSSVWRGWGNISVVVALIGFIYLFILFFYFLKNPTAETLSIVSNVSQKAKGGVDSVAK